MSDSEEKLARDLTVLEAMAAEMDDYLRSETLFWPLSQGGSDMPRLTLGGYLMRQHRLLALRHLLDEAQRQRLDEAIAAFNQALVERIVRFEERAHRELEARVRQWQEQLKDVRQSDGAYYDSAAETRAMIAALLDRLRLPPYRLDQALAGRVDGLDRALRGRFGIGNFRWPDEWRDAYPEENFWWLYGQPA